MRAARSSGGTRTADDRGDAARELGGVGAGAVAAGAGVVRRGRAAARSGPGRRPRPPGRGRRARSATAGRSTRRRQLAALLPERAATPARRPSRARSSGGPHVGEHLVQRGTDDAPSRPRPRRRRAERPRARRSASTGSPATRWWRAPGPRQARGPAREAGPDDVLGEHAGGDPDQLVGGQGHGVDGPGTVGRAGDADAGPGRACRGRGRRRSSTRSARPGVSGAEAARLSRRRSSSCWAPGSTRPGGAAPRRSTPTRASYRRRAGGPPSPTLARPRGSRRPVRPRRGSPLAQPAGLVAQAPDRGLGGGALGGLAGHHGERVERRRRAGAWG